MNRAATIITNSLIWLAIAGLAYLTGLRTHSQSTAVNTANIKAIIDAVNRFHPPAVPPAQRIAPPPGKPSEQ